MSIFYPTLWNFISARRSIKRIPKHLAFTGEGISCLDSKHHKSGMPQLCKLIAGAIVAGVNHFSIHMPSQHWSYQEVSLLQALLWQELTQLEYTPITHFLNRSVDVLSIESGTGCGHYRERSDCFRSSKMAPLVDWEESTSGSGSSSDDELHIVVVGPGLKKGVIPPIGCKVLIQLLDSRHGKDGIVDTMNAISKQIVKRRRSVVIQQRLRDSFLGHGKDSSASLRKKSDSSIHGDSTFEGESQDDSELSADDGDLEFALDLISESDDEENKQGIHVKSGNIRIPKHHGRVSKIRKGEVVGSVSTSSFYSVSEDSELQSESEGEKHVSFRKKKKKKKKKEEKEHCDTPPILVPGLSSSLPSHAPLRQEEFDFAALHGSTDTTRAVLATSHPTKPSRSLMNIESPPCDTVGIEKVPKIDDRTEKIHNVVEDADIPVKKEEEERKKESVAFLPSKPQETKDVEISPTISTKPEFLPTLIKHRKDKNPRRKAYMSADYVHPRTRKHSHPSHLDKDPSLVKTRPFGVSDGKLALPQPTQTSQDQGGKKDPGAGMDIHGKRSRRTAGLYQSSPHGSFVSIVHRRSESELSGLTIPGFDRGHIRRRSQQQQAYVDSCSAAVFTSHLTTELLHSRLPGIVNEAESAITASFSEGRARGVLTIADPPLPYSSLPDLVCVCSPAHYLYEFPPWQLSRTALVFLPSLHRCKPASLFYALKAFADIPAKRF
ncbi:hypothetical protein ADUPG1_008649 [Aduncisulcus paluster]|uniref:Uncharacterized protein n=1 Tax=Aduncisulcus paluster TaxID=2918883 RepID=A0ABQ5KSR2_9EUKA|nr:hypothetical protein ADUPG1_008649 [Aduncisulcus paluster]